MVFVNGCKQWMNVANWNYCSECFKFQFIYLFQLNKNAVRMGSKWMKSTMYLFCVGCILHMHLGGTWLEPPKNKNLHQTRDNTTRLHSSKNNNVSMFFSEKHETCKTLYQNNAISWENYGLYVSRLHPCSWEDRFWNVCQIRSLLNRLARAIRVECGDCLSVKQKVKQGIEKLKTMEVLRIYCSTT